jgi:hypothetical protein
VATVIGQINRYSRKTNRLVRDYRLVSTYRNANDLLETEGCGYCVASLAVRRCYLGRVRRWDVAY